MKDKAIKISLILPVMNPDFGLLERALQSVYEQTYQNYEILLVNDGSEEKAAEKLELLAAERGQVRLLKLKHAGVSAARNEALKQAEGDVITYLDSDDMFSRNCFEEAVTIFENYSFDAVWGGTFYGTEKEITERKAITATAAAKSKEALKPLLIRLDENRKHRTKAECIGEPFRFEEGRYISRGIAGRFIRKSALEKAGIAFPVGIRIYEDAIWNLEMQEKLATAYAKTEWYYYLENGASVSNSYNPTILADLETPLAEIRKRIDLDDPEEYRGYTRILMDSLRYVCKCLLYHPQWKAAEKEKKELKAHLYRDEPWNEIGLKKYKRYAEKRDCNKATLFRLRLLLLYWKLTWK